MSSDDSIWDKIIDPDLPTLHEAITAHHAGDRSGIDAIQEWLQILVDQHCGVFRTGKDGQKEREVVAGSDFGDNKHHCRVTVEWESGKRSRVNYGAITPIRRDDA